MTIVAAGAPEALVAGGEVAVVAGAFVGVKDPQPFRWSAGVEARTVGDVHAISRKRHAGHR